jgi:hypothetical protein
MVCQTIKLTLDMVEGDFIKVGGHAFDTQEQRAQSIVSHLVLANHGFYYQHRIFQHHKIVDSYRLCEAHTHPQ